MPLGGGGLTGSPGAVTHVLQADFSGTAFGGSPTWTDITGWWMSAGSDPGGSTSTIPWGRQDQSTTVESSSTSFVLNNADGRFTPGNVSSPYYPNVKRRVRMRETITDGTTTLTLFDGYVDSWTVTVQTNGPTLSTVSLADTFARFSASTDVPGSASTTLRSMVVEEMLLDAPDALYPLSEAAGASTAGDISAHLPAATLKPSKYLVTGSYAFGADNGLGGTGLRLTGSGTDGYALQVPGLGDITPNATTIVISFSTTASATQYLYGQGDFGLQLDATGRLTRAGTTGTRILNDGKPHTVVIKFTSALGVFHSLAYVDGTFEVDFGGGVFSGGGAWASGSLGQIGGAIFTGANSGHVVGTSYGPFFTGTVWNFGHYNALLTDARRAAYQTAATTAFAGESTAARWSRLLAYRPNLGGSTAGAMGTVGAGDLTGMSLGDALTDTATAEGGVIQTNRGTLTLIGRSNWYDPATTLTLNAANGEVDLPTTWRDDTQRLLNDITASRPNGADQRTVNAASVAADGVAQTSITANLNSDRDAADMAGWLVAVGVREQLDSPTLTVNLYARASSALTMAVCALKTYDVVTLTNLPASAPASTMTFQVQGGTYTIGADTFSVELYTTTMPPTVLRADATADTYTKLDNGLTIGW